MFLSLTLILTVKKRLTGNEFPHHLLPLKSPSQWLDRTGTPPKWEAFCSRCCSQGPPLYWLWFRATLTWKRGKEETYQTAKAGTSSWNARVSEEGEVSLFFKAVLAQGKITHSPSHSASCQGKQSCGNWDVLLCRYMYSSLTCCLGSLLWSIRPSVLSLPVWGTQMSSRCPELGGSS